MYASCKGLIKMSKTQRERWQSNVSPGWGPRVGTQGGASGPAVHIGMTNRSAVNYTLETAKCVGNALCQKNVDAVLMVCMLASWTALYRTAGSCVMG